MTVSRRQKRWNSAIGTEKPPMVPSAVHAMHTLLGPSDESQACQHCGSMSGVHGSRGEPRGATLLASIHHYRKDLQRLRKSLTLCPTS